ncbi:MAG: phosphomethylpyrimidine synthase ThiC, partial [Deferribacterales bacterium]|nr:phosphomethylpyrimidine synthase ThiC [Deferribacterales bacterium]
CLPDMDDVREGVIASKIAAHIADIAKGYPGAIDKDIQMSIYRKNLDWEGMFSMAIDPVRAREKYQKNNDVNSCTMCGKLCAVKIDKK